MRVIPKPLEALTEYNQFILWKNTDGKKLPIDHRTMAPGSAHDSATWLSADEAVYLAGMCGDSFGVGFVFTEDDPFFFVDIDHCLVDGAWSATATALMAALPGASVEVSQSGTGLHIIGRGTCPPHACKNIALGLELYTERRFVALTGERAVGDAGADLSAYLPHVVSTYYPPKHADGGAGWTDEPCGGWSGHTDDGALIAAALRSAGAASVFGGRAAFADLWTANADALSVAYPDSGDRQWDGSSADAALAQHLAFWTGKNCERIREIMQQSELVRDKWAREDYLYRTILNACAMQEDVHNPEAPSDNTIADENGAPKLSASSDAQRAYGENVRAVILETASESQRAALCASSGPSASAKFWIENAEKRPPELVEMCTPVSEAHDPLAAGASDPVVVSGLQYLTTETMMKHFSGCAYVQDAHRVFTPSGAMLKPEQFNATYGGYIFQLDGMGDKTTKKAWEAFTESQAVRFPKAQTTCFRPELPTGSLVSEESRVLVNTYIPIETERTAGDVSPFLLHLEKLLPERHDREIILSYMAACVQHKGVKFQWAPLLQGVEGNGKTLLTRCVTFAVGNRYSHLPPANELNEKFNSWLFEKLFIGIEEFCVPDNKREIVEIMKPMITNDRLAMRAMQRDQVMGDNRANFILNTNHRDAFRKTKNDRRFAMFFTAQQAVEDLSRDGMTPNYFSKLYKWLRDGGYAAVNGYLHQYAIIDEYNPASGNRAPETTTTQEAILAGMGRVEQAILEAIGEGVVGFAGGWVSSTALDRLLRQMRADGAIPVNKRRELMNSLGYDWHPALKNGRVNNPIAIDDGKKPRLFVRNGHELARSISSAGEVSRVYQAAQQATTDSHAAEVFKQG
jgi:hypothetical protein